MQNRLLSLFIGVIRALRLGQPEAGLTTSFNWRLFVALFRFGALRDAKVPPGFERLPAMECH
jgi:hypothetical protein